jgi:hypothetical protein
MPGVCKVFLRVDVMLSGVTRHGIFVCRPTVSCCALSVNAGMPLIKAKANSGALECLKDKTSDEVFTQIFV